MRGHAKSTVDGIWPVVLAGGSGARLWPLSTAECPKQFHALVGAQSLFQQTVLRRDGWLRGQLVVVCGDAHRALVDEQLAGIEARAGAILVEPVGRNTAPAIALAALHAVADGDDPLLLVLPADHHLANLDGLRAAVEAAAPVAEMGRLVTFGVVPAGPEPGYGYIRCGAPVADGAFAVEAFVEKPDRERARRLIECGDHFWNSGIFLFRASAILAEFERHCRDISASCREAFAEAARQGNVVLVDRDAFSACRSISIDHAVMEKTSRAVVLPLDADWSDVGHWPAVRQTGVPDEAGNVLHGDAVALDSATNFVRASSRSVALIGVSDLVVIETGDAVLVAHKDRAQDIRRLAELYNARQTHVEPTDRD